MASIRWDKNSAEYNIPPAVKKFRLPESDLKKEYAVHREKAKAVGNSLRTLGLVPSPTLTDRQAAEEQWLALASDHNPYVLSAYGGIMGTLRPGALPDYIDERDVQKQLNAGYARDFGEGWGRFSKMTDEEIAEAYEKAPRAERHKWKTYAFRRALAIHDLIYEKQQADQRRDAIIHGVKEGTKDAVAAVASNIPIVRDFAELGAYLTGFGSPRDRYIRNRTKDLDEYLESLSGDESAELLENWHLIASERFLSWDERKQREDLILKHPMMPLYGFVEDTWQPVSTIFDIYGGVGAVKQLMKMGAAGVKKLAAWQAARRAARRAGPGVAKTYPTAKEVARLAGSGALVTASAGLTAGDAYWLKSDVERLVTEPYAGAGNPDLKDYNASQREFSQILREQRDLGEGDDFIKQLVRDAFSKSE